MTENKFNLDRRIDIISKVCTILIPVVLFYFGNEFKKAQDAEIKEQQNFDRITTLLKSLSSDNDLEKKLAIKFSKGLADAGDFPTELLSVMDEVSTTDPNNSKDAQSVLNSVGEKAMADKNTEVEKKVKEVVENSPTKVYMQIPKGYSMINANQLFDKLKSEGYNMLGIERVDVDKSPSSSEVRYFKETDKAKAISLSESITKNTGTNIMLKPIPGYENKIIGSQLEIWLK